MVLATRVLVLLLLLVPAASRRTCCRVVPVLLDWCAGATSCPVVISGFAVAGVADAIAGRPVVVLGCQQQSIRPSALRPVALEERCSVGAKGKTIVVVRTAILKNE